MARQRRPAKQPPPVRLLTLHRVARAVYDWKIVVTGIVLLFSGLVFALGSKFATKEEFNSAKTDIQKHNEELSAIGQSLKDIRDTQDRELQWLWELKQTSKPRTVNGR